MDSLVPIAAKIALGIVGLWFIGRRIWKVLQKRAFYRQQERAGHPIRLTAKERRRDALELAAVVSFLSVFLLAGLFVLAAMLSAPAWVGWAIGGLIFAAGIIAASIEGLFL